MEKKKILMTVEASSTGFSIYTNDFPAHGYGKTVSAAKENLQSAVAELMEFYGESGRKAHPALGNGDIKFEYVYDIASIFEYFGMLDITNLAKKIGMNPSLLRQYKNGIAVASEKQKKRIENGLHQLGRELLEVRL